MAEQERKTKAERREEKRQRRMEEEAEAAAAERRLRYRNLAIAVALVAVLGGLGYLAAGNLSPTIEDAITVSPAEVEEARGSSGCEVLQVQPVVGPDGNEDRRHLEPGSAPPAEALYTQGRPTATGPHYTNPGPIYSGVRDEQLDERATTHNMEHGSVIIWFDPEQVEDGTVDEIDDMVATLNESGFASNAGRAGILASPFTDPGIESGKAIAIRSWGQGMDCEEWDEDYAYGWIAEHFGSRGPAPEAALGQYPEDVLEITDQSGGDETDGDDTADADADADADAEADTDADAGDGDGADADAGDGTGTSDDTGTSDGTTDTEG